MALENSTLDSFVDAIKQDKQTKDHIYQATVSRIDKEGVVYVNLPGSDQDTPTEMSAAEVKRGDAVSVEWRNNKLFIAGNNSNPAAGVQRVAIIETIAQVAREQAARANKAAIEAESSASAASASATAASSAASAAEGAASAAGEAANNALKGLSVVESVVDVINWFSEHKVATTDTTVDPNKTYYIYNSTTGSLTVATPTGSENPASLGWFEIDEAVANYIAKHLALTNDGLYIMADDSDWKVLVSDDGVYIIDGTGQNDVVVAKYKDTVQIGEDEKARAVLDNDEFTMYTSADTPAFYINNAGEFSLQWYLIYKQTLAANEEYTIDLEKQSDGRYDTSQPILTKKDDGTSATFTWGTQQTITAVDGLFTVKYNGSTTTPTLTWKNVSGSSAEIEMFAVHQVIAPAPYAAIGKRDLPEPDYTDEPGPLSFTVGQYCIAKGRCAVAIGQLNKANGVDSFAMGGENEVRGAFSAALGCGLRVMAAGQTVVGTYNHPLQFMGWETEDTHVVSGKTYYEWDDDEFDWVEVEPVGNENPANLGWYDEISDYDQFAFVVGIGDNGSESNGFGVSWDGEAWCQLNYDNDYEYYYGGFSDEGLMTKATRNKWHTILGESQET